MAFLVEKQPINWAIDHLFEHVKRGKDATFTADTIVAAWVGTDSVMRLVIGKNGFSACFPRSIKVTRLSYPWLAVLSQDDQSEVDLKLSTRYF